MKMKSYIKNYGLVLAFGLLLAIVLLPYYRDGKMILGGEGSYFLDFPLMLKNWGYAWANFGPGRLATSLNFGYVFHLFFLQILIF